MSDGSRAGLESEAPARTSAAPNLFVAGAPKCGTTSMHDYLSQHPSIFMCSAEFKEPQFWCYEDERPQWTGPGDSWMNERLVTDRAQYLELFAAGSAERYRGESSPYYLWDNDAARRIVAAIPDAHFLVMLRDPVDRAQSLWRHLWSQGRETEPTVQSAMAKDVERQRLGWEPFWQYRSMGLYGEQLSRLYAVVPSDQIKVVWFEDFSADPGAVLADIFRWLDVTDQADIDVERRYNTSPVIADTRVNRMIHVAVSRKSKVKRIIPARLRRAAGAAMLARMQNNTGTPRASGDDVAALRAEFHDDLLTLDALMGGVPSGWLR